jgi:acetolactate synthase regulatory subunit
MQWLFTIDTENDLIVVCRLVNTFRRKGIRIARLAMVSTAETFNVVVLFEAPEREIDHIFNFVRRTEGVNHVACYRHGRSADSPPFILVDADSKGANAAWAEFVTQSGWVFGSHGQLLAQVPAGGPDPLSGTNSERLGLRAFTRVKATDRPREASE